MCKDDVSVPPEGIKGFRHNFYVANAIEQPGSPSKTDVTANKRKQEQENSSETDELDHSLHCHRCEEVGVSRICLKCNIWLCPLCCNDHKRVKGTKTHILASSHELTNALINDDLKDDELSNCSESGHLLKVNSNYCVGCKFLVCDQCQIDKHSTHEVISIVSKVDEVRAKLAECLTRLQKRSEALHRQSSSLASARKDVVSHGQKALQDLEKSYNMVFKKMNSVKHNLQKNIKKHTTEQVSKLDNKITGINDKLTIEESVEGDMKAVLASNNKKSLLTQSDMLSDQAEHCLSEHLINLDNMLTISLPSWKPCEDDLFDQLITKLLGNCKYTGVEVNLNKRVKKKAKRSIPGGSKSKDKREVDEKFLFDQLESTETGNADDYLDDIIRDFDPFSPPPEETTNQQPPRALVQPRVKYPEWGHYFPVNQVNLPNISDDEVAGDIPQPQESVDGSTEVSSPLPPAGPFYNKDDNESNDVVDDNTDVSEDWEWEQPPSPISFFGDFPLHMPPPEFCRGGRGHPPPPPHHRHPRHHPPPPPPHHLFGHPPHLRGHHRGGGGRGHKHRPGRRGPPHHPF